MISIQSSCLPYPQLPHPLRMTVALRITSGAGENFICPRFRVTHEERVARGNAGGRSPPTNLIEPRHNFFLLSRAHIT